jgi:hypothetical protein
VHDIKDYGILCDLEANPDVVALAAPEQVAFPCFRALHHFPAASRISFNMMRKCDANCSEYSMAAVMAVRARLSQGQNAGDCLLFCILLPM